MRKIFSSDKNLSYFGRIYLSLSITKRKIVEYLKFDSILSYIMWAFWGILNSLIFMFFYKEHQALNILASIHRRAPLCWISLLIEKIFKQRYFETHKGYTRFKDTCFIHLNKTCDPNILNNLNSSLKDKKRFFYKRLIVIKSYNHNEKGVIIIKYTNMFRLFLQLFDINKICEKYYLVLEPSWCGYFDLDILLYATLDYPVFIQASEPRDYEFINNLKTNLIPVPIGANWWVDHRIFKPLNNVKKEFDLIMVASWVDYKRHYRVFSALNKIKKKGQILRAIFIGEPLGETGKTKDDVYREAKYYNVHKQIEIIEKISQKRLNYYFNCSKVNILWSRREGFNKAIIEGMFAGVPCIIRKGFNYGFKYPYINRNTGIFSSESALPNSILKMVDSYQTFSPRPWVMEHMSCHKATDILNKIIRKIAEKRGEDWTTDISVKINSPYLKYWDEKNAEKYEEDYEFLKSTVRL